MSTFRTTTPSASSASKSPTQQVGHGHSSSAHAPYPAAPLTVARPGDNFLSVAMRASNPNSSPQYQRK